TLCSAAHVTATTDIATLALHDALPIFAQSVVGHPGLRPQRPAVAHGAPAGAGRLAAAADGGPPGFRDAGPDDGRGPVGAGGAGAWSGWSRPSRRRTELAMHRVGDRPSRRHGEGVAAGPVAMPGCRRPVPGRAAAAHGRRRRALAWAKSVPGRCRRASVGSLSAHGTPRRVLVGADAAPTARSEHGATRSWGKIHYPRSVFGSEAGVP